MAEECPNPLKYYIPSSYPHNLTYLSPPPDTK